jgi:polyhydroxyalkanoate synthesis regulator phasin
MIAMTEDRGGRELRVRVSEEAYKFLESLAKREGFSSVEDYLVHLVHTIAREKGLEDFERIKPKIERFIQDEINKRMTALETIRRQVVEIYEKIESLEERLKAIEETVKESSKLVERPREAPPRKTGIERLREEKVVFESRLPARVQRDRLFAYFEREGAVVLKLSKERVAVDPEFWKEFKSKLESLSSPREEDIQQVLGSPGFELWKALYADNLIYYDPRSKRWRFVQEVR